MHTPLTTLERDALTRFITKLVDDVDRVASLLETRGGDGALPREAQWLLQRTLESLQTVQPLAIPVD